MKSRKTRAEQVAQNRERVLEAARSVFLERGYAGASLEVIADESGFSKGVVYSQFESKADLFLALLERRVAERAEQNARIAEAHVAPEGILELLRTAERDSMIETRWAGLLIDFRAHAVRDPDVNRRYAEIHARTLEGIAAALARVHRNAGLEPALPVRVMAQLVLALGSGIVLERAAEAGALPFEVLRSAILRMFGFDDPGAARPRRSTSRTSRLRIARKETR